MQTRNWKLLELYPEFKNKDILPKLSDLNVKYSIITERFIKADLTDEESKAFELMAFVHHNISKQNF